MKLPIVASDSPITVIGGANTAPAVLTEALKYGETVVCADGGANQALAAGLTPAAVIGDMDSISPAAQAAFATVLHPISEQNSTDFDKVLRNVSAPLIVGVGFLGNRFDHGLAVLHVLLKYRECPIILVGDEDLLFIAPKRIRLDLPVGLRVSLLPVVDARVTATGLKWEVHDKVMSMAHFIGSSNETAQRHVEIEAGWGLAVIMPPEALGAVVSAVTTAFHAE